jgi:hypothetical protein
MSPKEKAEELVHKYIELNQDYIDKYQSKPCALIAVDLVLDEIFWEDDTYWLEVKQEIEKL